ncbi:MAG: hypothetical protein Q7U53_17520 [Anaerolineaceae bacterium]|nr:hypothetical protein [Anaerolineaceae bacterium]
MSNEDNLNEDVPESVSGEIIESGNQELRIFVTIEDQCGVDVTKMSNFFDFYIQQLTSELSTNTRVNVIENIPISDIGILHELIDQALVISDGKDVLVPDFDSLPHDIKDKLAKGIYKMGESKQVDGNLRAVIMDENDIRVKDITLKSVINNPGTIETVRSITIQAMMRQIYVKLGEIQELQSYQIDKDRDETIGVPFINARDYILRAQIGGTQEEKRENLKKSTDELTKAINAIYIDLSTTSEYLANSTKLPIFNNPYLINKYIKYLTLDLLLVTKYVGVLIHVFDYLGEKASSNLTLEGYQFIMQDFFTKSINKKGKSAGTLIHEYYPYNENNIDWWYKLTMDIKSGMNADLKSIEGKEIFLVSAEDVRDGDKL